MQVRWLKTALKNLEQEAEYNSREDPIAAKQMVAIVFSAVDKLKRHTAMGKPGRVNGTRELIVPGTRYLIPYRLNRKLKQIEMLRVFHTSYRTPSQW